jgi:NADH-quinone oxidoreductase subunit J
MDYKLFLFYTFSAVLVAAALGVITARNPVNAALFLVLAFFNASGLWILLKAEFLAITLVLVYVGAVMVLFLFVVMMLDIDTAKLREGFKRYLPWAMLIGVVLALEIAAVMVRGFWTLEPVQPVQAAMNAAPVGNTRELGRLIYTQYVYAFEIAALILLVAIVAAVALTLRRRKDAHYNDPSQQVRVQAKDRLKIIKVEADSDRARDLKADNQAHVAKMALAPEISHTAAKPAAAGAQA